MTKLPPLVRVESSLIGYSILVPSGVEADLSDLLDGYTLELGGSDRFLLEVGRHVQRIRTLAEAHDDANFGYPPRVLEEQALRDGYLVIDLPAYGNQRAYSYFARGDEQYRAMCISREIDRDAVIAVCSSFELSK